MEKIPVIGLLPRRLIHQVTYRETKQPESASSSISLLISVLLRHPQLACINFDPDKRSLRFSFMLSCSLGREAFDAFRARLVASLEAYMRLEGLDEASIDVRLTQCQGITDIEVVRDVETLTQEEISLLIALVDSEFGDRVARDANDDLSEDDREAQDELIERMLDDIRESYQERNLIGFRDEGRVVVFNKPLREHRP